MTLVCVPGTLISRPQLSRTRYEALPVRGSQANETLHDVLPVERRFNGPAGGFLFGDLANAGESAAVIEGASGAVASRHAAATTRIDPARAHESDCRSADMGRLPGIRDSGWSPPSRSVRVRRTAVVAHLANGCIEAPWLPRRCPASHPVQLHAATLAPSESFRQRIWG